MQNVIDIEAFRSPPVRVERSSDPQFPGSTKYRISGLRCPDVQDYVNSLVAEVEMHSAGFASFVGPHLFKGRYVAIGFVVVISEVP
jgi:hypothetical protein